MPSPFESCLPDGVSPDTVVRADAAGNRTTVDDELMNARCDNGVLVDDAGRQIYFFQLIGCWGNPPSDYQDQLAKQDMMLQALRQTYTVVEITCNPSGVPIP